jgi:hypothetical protein
MLAHQRVKQHNGEDRDRFVRQGTPALKEPQPRRDRRWKSKERDHPLTAQEHHLVLSKYFPSLPLHTAHQYPQDLLAGELGWTVQTTEAAKRRRYSAAGGELVFRHRMGIIDNKSERG